MGRGGEQGKLLAWWRSFPDILQSLSLELDIAYQPLSYLTLIYIIDDVETAEQADTHSQGKNQNQPHLKSSDDKDVSRLSSSSSREIYENQTPDHNNPRDFIMAEMQDYYHNRNIKELQQENFYDKLMTLKKEQEEHIKLVESVYFKELRNNKKLSSPVLTRRPKSILKHSFSGDKVSTNSWVYYSIYCFTPNPIIYK